MHANARLTERVRRELVAVVDSGVSRSEAARRFGVSRTTVCRWVDRAGSGEVDWFRDRSSRPRSSPNRIPGWVEAEIVVIRRRWGLSPTKIAAEVGVSSSTVWRVLREAGLNRLPASPTQLVARYERDVCGDLVHVDTKRAGGIPAGGGRFVRGVEGYRTHGRKQVGTGHVWFHAAVDDHSRLAYVEVLASRSGDAAAGFWERARRFYRDHGIEVRQVMTDNALEYVNSKRFAQALAGAQHVRIRPYRPQTNGKVERFFRTLKDEWLYAVAYTSETERQAALTRYLHYYNHHRPHTSIHNQPPITRCTNLPEQHM